VADLPLQLCVEKNGSFANDFAWVASHSGLVRVYYAGATRQPVNILGWTALVTIALLLALLLQALASTVPAAPAPAALPSACETPVSFALADGDDVRARFLIRLCATSVDLPPLR
jgi:hypothetical protein